MNGDLVAQTVRWGRAVLASVLSEPEKPERWAELRSVVIDDFDLSDHKKIFAAMSRLSSANMQADVEALLNELGDTSTAAALVLDLRGDGTIGTKLSYYVQELKKASVAKECERLERLQSNATSAEEKRQIAQQIIELLSRGASSSTTVQAGLQIKFLSSVKAKPQGWLWEKYIPDNQLLGLYGPSHTAKSIIAIDWCARVTTAAKWPDGSQGIAKPRNVLMLAPGEDALDTVLKPRFVLAGGDPERLAYIPAVGRFDDKGDIFEDMASLDRDIPELDRVLSSGDFGMALIDPITNHLGDKKTNLENEVRPVLMRLKALAEKHKLPIVMVGHLNKRERGTAALDKVLGCRAFVGVPRTIYMTGTDNDTEERFCYELGQERGYGAKSWKYKTRMEETVVDGANVKEVALSWEGQSDATGQDVVDALSREEKRTTRELADQLVEYLRANGGTAPQEDCKKALGFPKVNWSRVRDKAHVKPDVDSGGAGRGGSASVWVLDSENTGTAAKTVSVSVSENTSTNIESFNSVFSGTSPRIHSENTSENTQSHVVYSRNSVLSEKAFDCPDCGAHFDTSAGLAKHSVDGCAH